MSKSPEQGPPKEQQPLPYYRAARFKTKQEAEQPYLAAQETIHTMDCDVSAYRFLRQWEEPSDKPWYVTVIGEKPPHALHQKITGILAQGEPAPLPDQAVAELYSRRLEQIQQGPWVERHYHPTVQKRNPNKDKVKRKIQKDSRRRNRGK